MDVKRQTQEPSLIILLFLVSFAAVSAVLFTPALPAMTSSFGISASLARSTISVFLVGYAIGHLFYGALSDRFGRKSTILLGVVIAIIGSVLILIADWLDLFWLVLVGRFLTAVGSCVGMTIAFTMIGDIYGHQEARKKTAYFMLAFAIGPGLAVALGGFLTTQFGWQSNFYFLAGYSVFIFILSLFLPETIQHRDPSALALNHIKKQYLTILKNNTFLPCALIAGCVTAFPYLFASEAPFIGISHIGLSPKQYGLLNIIPPLGLIVGSLLARVLVEKKGGIAMILFGVISALLASLIMLFFFLYGTINPWTLFIPYPFISTGQSMVFSNASSLAIAHAHNKSYASGMLNFINISIAALSVFIVQALPSKIFMMPLMFLIMSGIALILNYRIKVMLEE